MSRLHAIRPHTAELDLVHPGSHQPVGMKLHLVGRDGPEYANLMNEVAEAAAQRTPLTAEEVGIRVVLTAVVGWEDADGEPFDKKEFEKLIRSKEYGWVAEQVAEKLKDRAVFFKGSLNSSVSA